MQLKKLERDDLQKNRDKRIICHTMVKDYLRQMNRQFGDEFSILDRISYIADDLDLNFGICELDETHRYEVVPAKRLQSENWDEAILLITSEYYWKKFEGVQKLLSDDLRIETVYYFEDIDTMYYHRFLRKYENTPLKNSIVFRSGPRNLADYPYWEFTDNARALFDYMLENGYNEKWELYWLVGNPEEYSDYADIKNVHFLGDSWAYSENENERKEYYRAICLSKYFFFTEHGRFVRFPRDGQTRVQLWHAHGFKSSKLKEECSWQYEYMTVGGDLYKTIHQKLFSLHSEQLLITGLPKQDWLFNPISKEEWGALSVPEAEHYIFWIPTFRSTGKNDIVNDDTLHTETGLSVINTYEKLEELNGFLEENHIVIVVKLHPSQESGIGLEENYRNIVCLKNSYLQKKRLHINRLFSYADALISDYSSAVMDYTMLDRPIAFAADDRDDYQKSRGFVYENIDEYLPGGQLKTVSDFKEFIRSVAAGEDEFREKRRQISKEMNIFQDGQNAARVLDAVGVSR